MVTRLWEKTSKLKGSLSLLLQKLDPLWGEQGRGGRLKGAESDLKGLDCLSPFPAGQQRVKNTGLGTWQPGFQPSSTTGTCCVNLRHLASLSSPPSEIIIISLKYNCWEFSPHRAA